jgi:hypothetical protein
MKLSPEDRTLLLEALALMHEHIVDALATMHKRNGQAIVCDTFRHTLTHIVECRDRLNSDSVQP